MVFFAEEGRGGKRKDLPARNVKKSPFPYMARGRRPVCRRPGQAGTELRRAQKGPVGLSPSLECLVSTTGMEGLAKDAYVHSLISGKNLDNASHMAL